MDLSDMTFGIEFETTVPRERINDGTISIGGYRRGDRIDGLPSGWQAKSDCSIQAGPGRLGCEFVSPVLRGTDGLRQIQQVCEKFSEWGVKVNASCGCHVHIGFDRRWVDVLERLYHIVANHEKGIYAATGTKRRERSRWCRSIADQGSAAAALQNGRDRYRLLNVSNVISGGKPTVEFRAFSATTNASKAIGYVRLCLSLVQRASQSKRNIKWQGKKPEGKSPAKRKGEGQTEWARLSYQIGWTKGLRKEACGELVADDLPDLKDSKKMLSRLAKKYDAGDAE